METDLYPTSISHRTRGRSNSSKENYFLKFPVWPRSSRLSGTSTIRWKTEAAVGTRKPGVEAPIEGKEKKVKRSASCIGEQSFWLRILVDFIFAPKSHAEISRVSIHRLYSRSVFSLRITTEMQIVVPFRTNKSSSLRNRKCELHPSNEICLCHYSKSFLDSGASCFFTSVIVFQAVRW